MRVLLVDDQVLVRQGLRLILELGGVEVCETFVLSASVECGERKLSLSIGWAARTRDDLEDELVG